MSKNKRKEAKKKTEVKTLTQEGSQRIKEKDLRKEAKNKALNLDKEKQTLLKKMIETPMTM